MQISWVTMSIAAAGFWGLNYVLEQRAMAALSPQQLLLIISLFAFVTLACYCAYSGELATIPAKARDTPFWALGGVMVISLAANFSILKSIELSNASLAAIIEISYPIFTVLFAWLLLGQNNLTWSFALGGSLIMLGTYIVARFH